MVLLVCFRTISEVFFLPAFCCFFLPSFFLRVCFLFRCGLFQHAMIQECAPAGCLKKSNVSSLCTIDTGRLNKVRTRRPAIYSTRRRLQVARSSRCSSSGVKPRGSPGRRSLFSAGALRGTRVCMCRFSLAYLALVAESWWKSQHAV